MQLSTSMLAQSSTIGRPISRRRVAVSKTLPQRPAMHLGKLVAPNFLACSHVRRHVRKVRPYWIGRFKAGPGEAEPIYSSGRPGGRGETWNSRSAPPGNPPKQPTRNGPPAMATSRNSLLRAVRLVVCNVLVYYPTQLPPAIRKNSKATEETPRLVMSLCLTEITECADVGEQSGKPTLVWIRTRAKLPWRFHRASTASLPPGAAGNVNLARRLLPQTTQLSAAVKVAFTTNW